MRGIPFSLGRPPLGGLVSLLYVFWWRVSVLTGISDTSCRLKFCFHRDCEELDTLFASIDKVFRAFKKIDCFLASALSCRLDFKQVLDDIGQDVFAFSIYIRIFHPVQMALGYNPSSKDVVLWLEKGRRLFLAALQQSAQKFWALQPGGKAVSDLFSGEALRVLARDLGMDKSLVYAPPSGRKTQEIFTFLEEALSQGGGRLQVKGTADACEFLFYSDGWGDGFECGFDPFIP